MYQYYFERLTVWQDAKELVKDIYRLSGDFSTDERYGITSQLRRAAVSVTTNVAEGSARNTKKDQANFTAIAYSSLMETLNLLIICRELDYLGDDDYQNVRLKVNEIANKLNALRKTQISNQ